MDREHRSRAQLNHNFTFKNKFTWKKFKYKKKIMLELYQKSCLPDFDSVLVLEDGDERPRKAEAVPGSAPG